VIEEPVESQVTLHEEHASLLRRPVTDTNALKDVDWTDKTIEVTETAEQAVISKTARVAEEVVIRREGSDHVETVRDKVRRQQVEIDRLPAGPRKVA
jgi:stress response protein YsnF